MTRTKPSNTGKDKHSVQTSRLSRPNKAGILIHYRFKSQNYAAILVRTNTLSRPLSRPIPSLGQVRSGQNPFRGGLSCPYLKGSPTRFLRGYGS